MATKRSLQDAHDPHKRPRLYVPMREEELQVTNMPC